MEWIQKDSAFYSGAHGGGKYEDVMWGCVTYYYRQKSQSHSHLGDLTEFHSHILIYDFTYKLLFIILNYFAQIILIVLQVFLNNILSFLIENNINII